MRLKVYVSLSEGLAESHYKIVTCYSMDITRQCPLKDKNSISKIQYFIYFNIHSVPQNPLQNAFTRSSLYWPILRCVSLKSGTHHNTMTQPHPQGQIDVPKLLCLFPPPKIWAPENSNFVLSTFKPPSIQPSLCNCLENCSELSPVGTWVFSGLSGTILISNIHLSPKAHKHAHVFLTACPVSFCFLFNVGPWL